MFCCAAAAASTQAFAACAPATVHDSSVISCGGPSTGFGSGAEAGVHVSVGAGATVTRALPRDVIDLGDGARIANQGTVRASGAQNAVTIGRSGFIDNAGTILSSGGFGIAADAGSSVVNSGTILATDPTKVGILFLGSGISLTNTGLIEGGDVGVVLTAPGSILNSGTIRAGAGAAPNAGIVAGTGMVLDNRGLVDGGDGGIGVVLAASNTVLNSGFIRATGGGSSLFVTGGNNLIVNTGTLDGQLDVGGTGNLLVNSGRITISDALGAGATHSFAGTFTQTSTGTLDLRANANGVHDRLVVNGTAQLGGTLLVTLARGYYGGGPVALGPVLGATTMTGRFDTVRTNSAFITPRLTGSATILEATLVRTPFDSAPSGGANGRSVGAVLERNYRPGLLEPASSFYWNVLTSTAAQPLSQLTGEGIVDAQQVALESGSQFLQTGAGVARDWVRTGRVADAPFASTLAYANDTASAVGLQPEQRLPAPDRGWRLWASAYGGAGSLEGSRGQGTSGVNTSLGGIAAGLAFEAGDNAMAGVSVGGSRSSWSVSALATDGTLDSLQAGVYGAARWGSFYALGSAAYGSLDGSANRSILGIGAAQATHADLSGHVMSGRLELGWQTRFSGYGITPFVAIEAARASLPALSETTTGGDGSLALAFSSMSATSLPVSLGVTVDRTIDMGAGRILVPYATLAWVHETMPSRSALAALSLFPGQSFTVLGASALQDAARLSGGFRLAMGSNVAIAADLTGLMSDQGGSVAGTGRFEIRW